MMQRGDIHYIIDYKDSVGSEQYAGRPAIIVSNDKCNQHSPVVEIVFLTTKPKHDMPTHVTIRSTSKPSTALCEQITSVSVERLGDYAGTCSDQEMAEIDAALLISLALDPIGTFVIPAKRAEEAKLVEDLRDRLGDAIKERDLYKGLYDNLITSILNRRAD